MPSQKLHSTPPGPQECAALYATGLTHNEVCASNTLRKETMSVRQPTLSLATLAQTHHKCARLYPITGTPQMCGTTSEKDFRKTDTNCRHPTSVRNTIPQGNRKSVRHSISQCSQGLRPAHSHRCAALSLRALGTCKAKGMKGIGKTRRHTLSLSSTVSRTL